SSGRTDTGVHAIAQVFHFESDLSIAVPNWKRALQTLLPKDIEVKEIEEVDDKFHARFDALEKEYRYFILNSKERNVFLRNYMYFSSEKFDIVKMQEACKVFEETHNFTSFSSARSTAKGSKVRTLYEVSCTQEDE